MSYTYSKSILPVISDNYSFETISDIPESPLSYCEIDNEEEEEDDEKSLASSNMINYNSIQSKEQFVDIIVSFIYNDIDSKFNLALNIDEIHKFTNLFKILIGKCNLSLLSLMKNLIVLENLLKINTIPSFSILKRIVVSAFIITTKTTNKNVQWWSKQIGLSINYLTADVKKFTHSNSNLKSFNIKTEELIQFKELFKTHMLNIVRVV